MHRNGEAAFAAVEVLIWQLVTQGTLRAEPLAAELERYAGFSDNAAGGLRTKSTNCCAPAPACVVSAMG